VIESTRAALDYLQKADDDFGDLAAGAGRVTTAAKVASRAHCSAAARRKNRWTTRRCACHAKTQALRAQVAGDQDIVRDPAKHGLELPAIRNEPYFVALPRTRDIDVATAARLAEMPVDEFRALNPAFKRPVIWRQHKPTNPASRGSSRNVQGHLAAFEVTGQPLASWTAYTLRENEKLAGDSFRPDVVFQIARRANQDGRARAPIARRNAFASRRLASSQADSCRHLCQRFVLAQRVSGPACERLAGHLERSEVGLERFGSIRGKQDCRLVLPPR